MAKQRVLITGAAGRIGTILWRAWEEEDRYKLTLTDWTEIEGAKSRVEVGDLRDYALPAGFAKTRTCSFPWLTFARWISGNPRRT